MSVATGRRRAVTSLRDLAFAVGFTAYTSAALLLLVSGLASLLGAEGSAAAAVERMGGNPAALAGHHGAQAALDFLISAVNLALGLLLVWLRPRHLTARLLAVGLVGTAAAFNLSSHGLFVALAESWVNVLHFLLHAVSAVAYLHALLVFPDGRLAPGWPRRFLVVVYGLAGLELLFILLFGVRLEGAGPLSVLALFGAAPFQSSAVAASGYGAGIGWRDIVAADASFFVLFFGLLVPLVGLIAQVQRYRTAPSALERQQSRLLAWALTAALAGGLVFVVYAVASGVAGAAASSSGAALDAVEGWVFRVFPLLFAVIPLALFTGLLRYRLWDIDRAINGALVYGLLTAILGLVYLVTVAVLGGLFGLLIDERLGELAIGVGMLAVAALFGPLRRRVQVTIDRRFYRRRYDAARTLQAFSARLREEVDLGRVGDDVLGVVDETVAPAHAALWLHAREA